jgi:DNA-binding response OmpR family regulator
MPHILLVDNDQASLYQTSELLTQARYHVSHAEDGRTALRIMGSAQVPDLIMLDSVLPDQDGIEVCRRIRRTSDVPIMFLSSRAQTDDRVHGLQNGADDYMSKRTAAPELLARVRAVLARTERARRPINTPIALDGWKLDPEHQICTTARGEAIDLTPRETHLLGLLFKRAGQVCPTGQIVNHVWSYAGRQARSIVATSIWRLRTKLEIDAQAPRHLLTVRNIGYTFRP